MEEVEGVVILEDPVYRLGITRRIDSLGRVRIPKSFRESLGVKSGDSLSVFVENHRLVIEVKERSCVFCGSKKGRGYQFRGQRVCSSCHDTLLQMGVDNMK